MAYPDWLRLYEEAVERWALRELAAEDQALARFEDEGGPPEVEAEHCFTCGGPCMFLGVDWGSRPDWARHRRRGSYTGSAGF